MLSLLIVIDEWRRRVLHRWCQRKTDCMLGKNLLQVMKHWLDSDTGLQWSVSGCPCAIGLSWIIDWESWRIACSLYWMNILRIRIVLVKRWYTLFSSLRRKWLGRIQALCWLYGEKKSMKYLRMHCLWPYLYLPACHKGYMDQQ